MTISRSCQIARCLGATAASHSYAYADSYTDLPLLEWVGHAVAVYPDDELATHAQSQGWETIGDTDC